jgi:heme-degrading monooxygenase HmoA
MKGRVVFHIHLKPNREKDFLQAYEAIRHEVANGVKGHIADQICQDVADPLNWLITSEWENIDDFIEWEKKPEHATLAKPMRDCWDQARSHKFVVRQETRRGSATAG